MHGETFVFLNTIYSCQEVARVDNQLLSFFQIKRIDRRSEVLTVRVGNSVYNADAILHREVKSPAMWENKLRNSYMLYEKKIIFVGQPPFKPLFLLLRAQL